MSVLPSPMPSVQPNATAVVRDAVRALAQQRRGVTAFVVRYDYHEHGPGHDERRQSDSVRVREDGRVVAVRFSTKGDTKTATPADPYILPVTVDALDGYRFEFSHLPCSECSPESLEIAFTSLRRDADHADGLLIVDPAARRIERLTFHPSVLPARADSGDISICFGPVLPDLWDIVDMHERYTGHVLFMHGWAEIETTYGAYRRFGTVDEALHAYAAGELTATPLRCDLGGPAR